MKKILKFFICMFMLSLGFLGLDIFLQAKTETLVLNGIEYTFELSEDGTFYILNGINIENRIGTKIILPSKYNNLLVKEITKDVSFFYSDFDIYYEGTITDWLNISFGSRYSNPMSYAEKVYMLNEEGTYELLDEFVIPEGTEEIKPHSIVIERDQVKKIVIPKTVRKFHKNAFYFFGAEHDLYYQGTVADWCKIEINGSSPAEDANNIYMYDEKGYYYKLKKLVIPEGITEINSNQFNDFESVSEIYLPKSVKKIGENAFNISSSYKKLYYNGTVADWCNIEFENAYANPMDCSSEFYLSDKNNSYVLVEELEIPKSVTVIGNYQFYDCSCVKFIIHNSVKEIGTSAFYRHNIQGALYYNGTITDWCKIKFTNGDSNPLTAVSSFYMSNNSLEYKKVTNLSIPGSVGVIGDYQFIYSPGVTSITVGEGVTSIGNKAFYNIRTVTNIKLANSITEIKEEAFSSCFALININIPNKLTVLEKNVIDDGNLESITIPKSIKEVKAQGYFSDIKNVYYEGTIEEWSKIINAHILVNDVEALWCLKENGEYAKVTDLIIPEGVKTLDNRFIDGYLGLENVYLPKSLKSISLGFFGGCENLKNIYFNGTVSDWLKINFESETSNPLCYAEKLYMLDENKQYFEVTNIEIPSDITTIKAYSLIYFGNLTSITLNKNIEKIEDNVFIKCNALESVYYNGTISDWLNITFEGSKANPLNFVEKFYVLNDEEIFEEVTELIIPEGTKTIGKYQFYGLTNLAKISIPDSVVEIGDYAFYCTESLDLEVSKNIEYIGTDALRQIYTLNKNLYFRGTLEDWLNISGDYRTIINKLCEYASNEYLLDDKGEYYLLNEIVIPTEITVIPAKAFLHVRSIEKVTIPSHVEVIEEDAFFNLNSIQTLIIEKRTKELVIKNNNFVNYSIAISEIYYQGTPSDWLNIKFETTYSHPANSTTKIYFLNEANEYYELKHLVISEDVTEISSCAFLSFGGLEEVTISSSLTKIDSYAFASCKNLKKVNIPENNNLTTIGAYAFAGCTSLESINLEACKKLTTIMGKTFNGNSALKEITLPQSLEKLGAYTFENCLALEKINFEENIKIEEIPNSCFRYAGIKEMIIPKSVKVIGEDAFYSCKSLIEIRFEENSNLEEICDYAFHYAPIKKLYLPKSVKKLGSYLMDYRTYNVYYEGDIIDWCNIDMEANLLSSSGIFYVKDCNGDYIEQTELVIPKEVKKISYPFWTSKLTTVYYDGTLKDWLNLEFGYTKANPMNVAETIYLRNEQGEYYEPTEVVIPAEITKINDYQFYCFPKLTKVVIHKNVEYLGDYAFAYCKMLEEVVIEEESKILAIPTYCFAGCQKLRYFNMPSNVTTIGSDAFSHCYQLTSIVIPEKTTSVNSFAFYNCYSLKLVYNLSEIENDDINVSNDALIVNQMNDSRVTIIDDYIFIKKDGINYLIGYTGKDEHLVLPTAVNNEKYVIADYTFYQNNFIKSIKISDFVTEIGYQAFYNCTALEEVSFGLFSSLTIIRYRAFENCFKLRYFVFPKDLENEYSLSSSFENCSKVKVVYNYSTISNESIKYIFPSVDVVYNTFETNVFIEKDGFLFIRKYDEYELIEYLGDDHNVVLPKEIRSCGYTIDEKAFKNCDSIESLVISKGVIGFDDYALSNIKNLKTVTFEEGVTFTELSKGLFYYCVSLERIEIPNSVEHINHEAFYHCESLVEVIIPNSVKTIGNVVFEACINLKTIEIPTSVLSFGPGLFRDCTSLEKMIIHKNITVLSNSTFNGCTNLKEVIFEEGSLLTSIDGFAFSECTNLESISIPKGVTEIKQYAFNACSSLKEMIFDEQSELSLIGDTVFASCKALEEIEIPSAVSIISNSTFSSCSNLKTIYLPGGIEEIGSRAFASCESIETVYFAGTIDEWNNITINYNDATPINGAKELYVLVNNEYQLVEEIAFTNNPTKIDNYTFYGYQGLKIINIPSSVTNIGLYAFNNCTSLTDINVDENNANYKSIEGNLYSKDGSSLLKYAPGKVQDLFIIPDGVRTINYYAFTGTEKISTIQLPMSVISIGRGWMYGETNWTFKVYEHSYGLIFVEDYELPYELIEVDVMIGDLSGNNVLNTEDIIYLLKYIYFPESYPINHYPDYNNDKKVDVNDALQLLWHLYFPEQYPIA